MGKRKRTPEEEEAFRRQLAEWEQERRDFEAMVERLHARWRAEDERRERRRRLLMRFLPFRRAA
jgi:septal ring factor EnvC (AmiA/AmiB activator)